MTGKAAAPLDRDAVHALRNHLAVILGFVELVISGTSPDDPRRADLVEIRDAALEASKLVQPPEDSGPTPGSTSG